MKTLFEICFYLVLAGVPLQLLFWCVVRPVLLTKTEFEISRIRETFPHLASTTTKEGKQALHIMEDRAKSFLNGLHCADALLPFLVKIPPEIGLKFDRDSELINDAPPEIRAVNRALSKLAFGAAIINSPGIVVLCLVLSPFVFAVGLCCVLTNRARKEWESICHRIQSGLYYPDKTAPC
jgi:hypothetical protein